MNPKLSKSEINLIAQAISSPSSSIVGRDIVVHDYDVDDVVSMPGKVDSVAYVILSGSLRTVCKDIHQRIVTLSRYERGSLIGEKGWLRHVGQRDVSILAADRCRLALIPDELLRRGTGTYRGRDALTASSQDELLMRLETLSATGAEIVTCSPNFGPG